MLKKCFAVLVLLALPLSSGALTLDQIIVSRTQDGPPADGKFLGGERVFIRLDVTGFERKEGRADLSQDVVIEAPYGITMVDQKNAGGVHFERPLDPTAPATVTSVFQFPNGPQGTWEIRITVNDRVAGTAATQTTRVEVLKNRTPVPVVQQ